MLGFLPAWQGAAVNKKNFQIPGASSGLDEAFVDSGLEAVDLEYPLPVTKTVLAGRKAEK